MADSENATAGLGMTTEASLESYGPGLLGDLKAVLEEAGITASIFTGWQPDSPGTCITLFQYAGQPPNTLIKVETPGVQARIRQAEGAYDYQKCEQLASEVNAALHDKTNFSKSGALYIHITAQQSPFFLQRDENNRPEFIVNFLVKKTRK